MKPVHSQPLPRAFRYATVDLKAMRVFDDVDILHPATLSAPQHGTCILRLVDILRHQRNMPGAGCRHTRKNLLLAR